MSTDLAAVWEVPLNDKVHVIEFEHGTTTGKRVVRVDGKEWMFKLVGNEDFKISDQANCQIQIRATMGFNYNYTLFVNGKLWKTFKESQEKSTKTWTLNSPSGSQHRIVLEKDSMDIWVDGIKIETEAIFCEEGMEMQFEISDGEETVRSASMRTISSGNERKGIVYCLIVDGQEVPDSFN